MTSGGESRSAAATAAIKRRLRTQSISIAVSVMPFGLAFGVTCSEADLRWFEAQAFSALVFTGGSQFAAVGVLKDGGTAAAAIISGLLLAIRNTAYGMVMTPALRGPFWRRALESQFMIDETMAVGTSHGGTSDEDRSLQRYGYLWCGCALFLLWNLSTLAGALLAGSAGEWTRRLGIDATIPASFLALVWPRLLDPLQRWVALGGAVIATALIPLAPPGIPIIAAGLSAGVAQFITRQRAGGGEGVDADVDAGVP